MKLDDLRTVQAEERSSGDLKPLSDEFYREVADYLAERRAARERAAAEAADPFGSDEVRRLTDEIETAEEVVEAIYERRVGKVVGRASLAAADMPADDTGLTQEEAALFDDLVGLIRENRREVLETVTGDGPPASATRGGGPTDGEGDASGATDGAAEPAPAPPADDQPSDPGGNAADSTDDGGDEQDRVTLRITRDVGEIFGVDERTYTLSAEDVVTLPAENAKPLLERDAAHRID